MADLVQCRRKPPVLVPLNNPLRLPPERLRQRITLIVNYAERYRELDEIEAREYLNLKHILATGTERPLRGEALRQRLYTEEEQRIAILAVLD